jgi:tetratricopeptide (TPR) repeat protein
VLHDSLREYFRGSISAERSENLAGRTFNWLRENAQRLADGGNPEEAITYMGNAVAIETDPVKKASSLEFLAKLRRHIGDFPGAIEEYRAALANVEETTQRARLHRKIAKCLSMQGYLEEAESEIDRGLELLPSEPSVEGGWLLFQRAEVAFNRQDFDECYEELQRVLSWTPGLSLDLDLSGSLANLLALIHLEDPSREDPVLAEADLQEAIKAFQASRNVRGLSVAYNNLGLAVLHLERIEEAVDYFDQSAAIAKAAGDLPCLEGALFSKAFCLMDGLGDYEAAESLYQETFRLAKETHMRQTVVWHHKYFGDLYRRQGRYEEARESLDYFLAVSKGMINEETRVRNLALMVRVCINCGNSEAADEHLSQAVQIAKQFPSRLAKQSKNWAKASVHASRGRAEKADTCFQKALELSKPGENGELLLEYGRFLAASGQEERAKEVLLQACRALEKISKSLQKIALAEIQSLEATTGD